MEIFRLVTIDDVTLVVESIIIRRIPRTGIILHHGRVIQVVTITSVIDVLCVTVGFILGITEVALDTYAEPVVDFSIKREAESLAVHSRLGDNTVLIIVVERQEIATAVATALKSCFQRVSKCCMVKLFSPVSVDAVIIDKIINVIVKRLTDHFAELKQLLGVHHFEMRGQFGTPAHIGADGYIGILSIFTFLGSDHDDTVGGARTVDGHGSGVFQHGDVLDVSRVKSGEHCLRNRRAIHDIQRLGRCVERVDTTDHHIVLHAGRVTRIGEDCETCDLSLKCVNERGGRSVLEDLVIHHCYRADD